MAGHLLWRPTPMNDLGTQQPRGSLAEQATPTDAPKTIYPTLKLSGEQAELAGLNKCAIGDEYEVTVRIRATRLGGHEYPDSGKPPAEFDVIASDDPVESTESAKDEPEPEKKAKSRSRIKSPKDSGFKDAYDE